MKSSSVKLLFLSSIRMEVPSMHLRLVECNVDVKKSEALSIKSC